MHIYIYILQIIYFLIILNQFLNLKTKKIKNIEKIKNFSTLILPTIFTFDYYK